MRRVLRFLDLLYLPALAIAGVYLYRRGTGIGDMDVDAVALAAGSLLLFGGLSLRSWYWHRLLLRLNIHVQPAISIASQLKPVLLKFIPGKVLSFAGRTAILVEGGASVKPALAAAVAAQALNVLTGLMLGVIGLALFTNLWGGAIGWLLVVSVLVTITVSITGVRLPGASTEFTLGRIRLRVPEKLPPFWDLIALAVLCWLLIGAAFWLFLAAIGHPVGAEPLFFQAAANSIGILAVFTPSGLGVREAVGVWYLSLAGIATDSAISAMILARFWTVAIEVLATGFGAICHAWARSTDTRS